MTPITSNWQGEFEGLFWGWVFWIQFLLALGRSREKGWETICGSYVNSEIFGKYVAPLRQLRALGSRDLSSVVFPVEGLSLGPRRDVEDGDDENNNIKI